jgi:lipoprotein-anchoring transpeptidase ErfK/SrfK
MLLAGCGGGPSDQIWAGSASTGPRGAPGRGSSAAPAGISITPSVGAKDVRPEAVVKVAASDGKLTEVRVEDADGQELTGALSPDGTGWRTTTPLRVGSSYDVHAWAAGSDGGQVEKTSRFATRSVQRSGTLQVAMIAPHDGAVVGVAQPIAVEFQMPVSNRKLVQAALQVTTTPPVAGAWYWVDDSHVHFRPRTFWPSGTRVRLEAKLAGISAGKGVVGGRNVISSFTVGRSELIRVDTRAHKLTVERDGRPIKSFDASTGKPGWETRDGTEVMMDRVRHKHWTNTAIGAKKHFSLYSKYAIRITDSGEFVHDAPWDKAAAGDSNTSHGCVGLKPGDMKWIWDNSLTGDPVIVTGTPRHHQDVGNTYDDWNIAWPTWSKGDV